MERKSQTPESLKETSLDLYTIVRDICANWYFILALTIAVALFSYVRKNKEYQSTYTIESIYAVTSKGINNSVYENLTNAQDTAAKLTQIINSSTMKNMVAEDLGLGAIPGRIRCEVVQETNLLSLKVTATTPEMSYKILESVMENYPQISQYVLGNVILDVLMEPNIPTEPDKTLNVRGSVTKAALITAVLAAMFVVGISYMKDTVRNRADVEKKLDTHLLGAICHEEKNKTLSSKIHKKKQALLITNPVVSFRYVEMVQKVCCKVQNHMDGIQAKTLLVTSCLENEGKSTVAANLALAFARSGKKVVLLDLDFRKPSQHKIFDRTDEVGNMLARTLMGKHEMDDDMITQMDNGLWAIFNGKKYSQSTEMLTAGHLEEILEYLKARYDYVIVDTPPMAYVADAEEIAHMTDASLVVVREHTANAKTINDMLDALGSCKGKLLGCVFNDAHKPVGSAVLERYGYGYRYGYYYMKEKESHE